MSRMIKKGSTDVTDYIVIRDSSDGTVETGVTITDLDLQYVRNGAAPSAKVDATALAAIDSAHSDNKMIEVDATGQPGLFRVDWPDAAFASGVDQVVCTVKGTGFDPVHKEYQLVDFDLEDAVRLGLTALPNAAADAAGGLPISDGGGLDLDTKLANTNEVTAARMGALTDWINGGRLDLILDELTAQGDTNETKIDTVNTDLSNATDGLGALKTLIDELTTQGDTNETKLDTIAGYIDTEITTITNYVDTLETTLDHASHGLAALKTLIDTVDNFVDTEVAAIKAVTDKMDDTLEDDAGTYRFTTNALEQAPSGGGGGDATEANQTTIIGHLTDMKGATFDTNTDSLEVIANTIGSVGGVAGAGSETWVYTLTDADTGNPIADADVWVTSDLAGSNVLASGDTDQNGQVTFYLDVGTVYVWRQKSGWNFTNPDTETVT